MYKLFMKFMEINIISIIINNIVWIEAIINWYLQYG